MEDDKQKMDEAVRH